ncbi:hypothetical protein GS506_16700 [Rhodococcus hoagii]|nr:hypothetical protein [Prescottella equi]
MRDSHSRSPEYRNAPDVARRIATCAPTGDCGQRIPYPPERPPSAPRPSYDGPDQAIVICTTTVGGPANSPAALRPASGRRCRGPG